MIPSRFFLFILMISFIGLFWGSAFGEDKKEIPVFTNQDIEKYKTPSDNNVPVTKTKTDKAEKSERAQKIMGDREKEYWCKKTTQYRNKKEKIEDDIKDIEKRLSKNNICWKTKKSLRRSLENAQKRLRYAEKDIVGLEDDAHRKGIPPGWLRCQFE